jgi:sugar phosphate isomerase/epimerase
VHEKVAVNALAFGSDPIEAVMDQLRQVGSPRVSFISNLLLGENLPKAKAGVEQAGYKVETVTHMFCAGAISDRSLWEGARATLGEVIKGAQTVGARSIYLLTGGRGTLDWEGAAKAFAEALAPCLDVAKTAGVELLIEPAPMVYADFHIAHTLRDTTLVAEMAGIGICLDVFPIWIEGRLKESIAEAGKRIRLVQVGDNILGDRCLPSRAVVGEGAIPLKQIFSWILETGYTGNYDIEMLGPRVVEIGPVNALRRSAEKMDEILRELGV